MKDLAQEFLAACRGSNPDVDALEWLSSPAGRASTTAPWADTTADPQSVPHGPWERSPDPAPGDLRAAVKAADPGRCDSRADNTQADHHEDGYPTTREGDRTMSATTTEATLTGFQAECDRLATAVNTLWDERERVECLVDRTTIGMEIARLEERHDTAGRHGGPPAPRARSALTVRPPGEQRARHSAKERRALWILLGRPGSRFPVFIVGKSLALSQVGRVEHDHVHVIHVEEPVFALWDYLARPARRPSPSPWTAPEVWSRPTRYLPARLEGEHQAPRAGEHARELQDPVRGLGGREGVGPRARGDSPRGSPLPRPNAEPLAGRAAVQRAARDIPAPVGRPRPQPDPRPRPRRRGCRPRGVLRRQGVGVRVGLPRPPRHGHLSPPPGPVCEVSRGFTSRFRARRQ